jgi:signal transduction histidine kinase
MLQFIDLTDSVLFDMSKEKTVLLQTINAQVSHELRNPLNAIIAQLLSSKLIVASAKDFVLKELKGVPEAVVK